MKQMAKVLGILSVVGLCLLVWLLCRPVVHRAASVGVVDPGASVAVPAPICPVAAGEPSPPLSVSLAARPNSSRSHSSPLVSSPPDRAERKPARVVRSESYKRLEELIKKYADLHGVDEDLVWAVIRHESGFDPGVVSPKGAMGLMQLMPGTAALLGVKDPFNVEQNIQGGIRYLEMCLARFGQDVGLALAAYNAGPQNVAKYQGCPPFPETQHYVAAVLQDYAGPPPRRGLRLRNPGPASGPEAAEPAEPTGLHWNLPAPVVNVSKPQWRLHPPRWHDFSLPWKLQALAAKSPVPAPRLGQRE